MVKKIRIRDNPELSHQIFTLFDLESYRTKGILSKPVYFDTDAICSLSNTIGDLEKANNKIAELKKIVADF